tara:strand:- start:2975 stop:3634 length:660 start_codon:yes stop_codon:yes gene_type:complete
MSEIMEKELNKLEKMISNVSTKVEENMNKAIESYINMDIDTCQEIIKNDDLIDRMEIEIEEECLKILALHQPVAIDLRYIIAILKINNDLERIGDLTSNICKVVTFLADKKRVNVSKEIPKMTKIVSEMLNNSLNALFNKDVNLAQSVSTSDDDVDELNAAMYQIVRSKISDNSELVDQMMPQLSVSRYLERIADHCTNIAEDVEYYINGEIVRHKSIN